MSQLGLIRRLRRRSKRFLRVVCLIGLAGTPTDLAAQRVTILDFSSTAPKPRRHPPKPFPPGTVFGGHCGGVIAGKLVASLVSLDRTEYTIGDEFNYVLEVRTAGTETVKVPTVLSVADLEPEDPNMSFKYEAMEIGLELSEESAGRFLLLPLLLLYGSDAMPGTLVEIKPGMVIEIRGKAKLAPIERENTLFQGVRIGASEDLPNGAVRVSTSLWRGDKYYYDGSTHHEGWSGFCPEEERRVEYGKKITLLSSAVH
jgi:hypothetical protein